MKYLTLRRSLNCKLIEKRSKLINFYQIQIKIISKLWSSTQTCCWNQNRIVIVIQIWNQNLNWRRRFNLGGVIALAYQNDVTKIGFRGFFALQTLGNNESIPLIRLSLIENELLLSFTPKYDQILITDSCECIGLISKIN